MFVDSWYCNKMTYRPKFVVRLPCEFTSLRRSAPSEQKPQITECKPFRWCHDLVGKSLRLCGRQRQHPYMNRMQIMQFDMVKRHTYSSLLLTAYPSREKIALWPVCKCNADVFPAFPFKECESLFLIFGFEFQQRFLLTTQFPRTRAKTHVCFLIYWCGRKT